MLELLEIFSSARTWERLKTAIESLDELTSRAENCRRIAVQLRDLRFPESFSFCRSMVRQHGVDKTKWPTPEQLEEAAASHSQEAEQLQTQANELAGSFAEIDQSLKSTFPKLWGKLKPLDEMLYLRPNQAANRIKKLYGKVAVSQGGANRLQMARAPDQQRVVTTNGDRDKWLYQQCSKAQLSYKEIAIRLKKNAETKNWEIISDPKAIKAAANRWACRNDEPPVPPRQYRRSAQ
jgi:hypothetical protein